MAAPTRDFAIVYGSLTLGRGSSPDMPIDGRITMRKSYDEFECEFSFIVFGTTPANFKSRCDTVEDELRTPYQDLTITVGDTSTRDTWYDFKQSEGTGYGHRAEIRKTADTDHDSGLSRRYTARIVVQLPADKLGDTNDRMGRRDSVVAISTEPNGRRTVSISGTFTGVPSASGDIHARDQYDSKASAYCLAVLSALDSTASFELVTSTTNTEDSYDDTTNVGKGGVLEFVREYKEILFAQGNDVTTGTLDDPEITNQSLTATRHRFNQELGANDPTTLDYANVSYSCSVDKSVSGVALRNKYDSDIRPFIVTQVRSLLPIYSTAIVSDDVDFNFDENTISVSMQIGGLQGGETVEGELTVDDSLETGQVLVPFWGEDPHSKFQYQGPARRTRTVTARQRLLSNVDGSNPLEADGFINPNNGVVVSKSVSTIPIRIPADFRNSKPRFEMFDRITTIVIEYFVPVGGPSREVGQDMDEALEDLTPEAPGQIGLA